MLVFIFLKNTLNFILEKILVSKVKQNFKNYILKFKKIVLDFEYVSKVENKTKKDMSGL